MERVLSGIDARCFLCLHLKSAKTKCPPDPSTETVQLYSLRCLLEYLKLDRRTDKVTAKLCPQCAFLIAHFSKLFRQLEKIEMEMLSSLQLIYEKLQMGKEMMGTVPKLAKTSSILEDLRTETRKKCYRKIRTARPRINVQKLTLREVKRKGNKLKNNSLPQNSLPSSNCDDLPEPEIEIASIKVEPLPENSEMDYNSVESDEAGSNYSPEESVSSAGKHIETDSNSEDEEEHVTEASKTEAQDKLKKAPWGPYKYPFELVAPPDSDPEMIKKPQYSFNKETKGYLCKICGKEYTLRQNFITHYKSTHIQYRYKCTFPSCDKDFCQSGHFYRHYECHHMGVRFKCPVCNRHFALKNHLKRHQQRKSCWRKPPQEKKYFCHCGKGFTIESNLKYHVNEVHLERGKFSCDLCEKKFNRSGNLIDHRRNVHHLPK